MSEIATAAGISFRLTDEQLELQRLAHEFAERELRPIAHEWDEREDFPRELLAKAASVGLTAGAIPREYGGSEVDAVTASLIAEELAWGCAGLSSTFGATSFPVRPLVRFGTEEQRQRYLPRLASDQGCLAAIAFTEPHAGSDVASIRSTATRDADGFVLNGEKAYITNGGIAEITLVFAKLDGEITTFIAEESDEGIRLGRKDKKVGLRASHTGSVVLDNLRLPEDRLLGPPGQGFLIAMDFFEASRPQVAASALGVARAAFEYATEYARDREAFGRPLMDKQGVAFKLAEMAMTIEASRLLVWRAAAAVDAGEDAGLFGSYAKAMAADTAMRTATDAVQILGGAGIMREHPVEKWLRDAKVFQIVEGTSEIQRQIIATYLKHGWRERPR
jgi:acyl-CoA dehydrogenase